MAHRLDYNHYNIAWIAPLPIEAEAALLVLDRRHEGHFESKRGDDYVYIGGEINGHNIVVATLPVGQNYGVGAAAALLNQVKTRFNNIWFALLVGVAAGLPNLSTSAGDRYRDIRLGDVLVCVPDKASTGIIHYDLGRDVEGQDFEINGRQAEAPSIVRSAIGNIQLTIPHPYKRGNDLAKFLKSLQDQDEHVHTKFQCPPQESDRLSSTPTKAPYKRESRDDTERTKVWYGSIGSGNSLMRNAQRRDELRDKYNLIGLEMEAAGVMNSLPTGVVRGVCDYGDEHKSKEWQPYAAAVAAVYAKGILYTIQPDANALKSDNDNNNSNTASILIPFPRDPDFVSRDILDKITNLYSATASRVALVGIGGIGKSQLAIEYCFRVRETSPSKWVFWVHAGSASQFEESYRAIARALNLPCHDDSQADVLATVHRWLNEDSSFSWLMVLDNADDERDFFKATDLSDSLNKFRLPEQPRTLNHSSEPTAAKSQEPPTRLLARYLPRCSHGQILITTRSRKVGSRLSGSNSHLIAVSPMLKHEATTLLEKKLASGLYDLDPAQQLVEHLDYIPLAISQAAAYISHRYPRCSLQMYNELLQQNDRSRYNILNSDEGDLRRNFEAVNSAVLTWQLSFHQIRDNRLSAADLLCLMSFFHNQDIPEHALKSLQASATLSKTDRVDLLDEDDYSSDEEKDLQTEALFDIQQAFENDVQLLRDYDLIGLNSNLSSFKMHALVQLSTQRWLRTHEQYAPLRDSFVSALNHVLPPDGEYEYWMTWQTLQPHIEAMLAHKPGSSAAMLQWASILYRSGQYLQLKGDYASAEKMLRKSLRARQKILNEDHEDVLSASGLLGLILFNGGQDREAEQLYRATLQKREEVLGAEHPQTLASKNDLAVLLDGRGRFEEAEKMYRDNLAIREKVLGGDHPQTLRSMNNLAGLLGDQGYFKEAEQLFRATLAKRERVIGVDHPQTVVTRNDLGSLLSKQGYYTEAEDLFRTSLKVRERVLGTQHPHTLLSMNDLAVLLDNRGHLEEAEQLFRVTLKMREKTLGVEHPDTLMSRSNLAVLLQNQGRYEEAEQAHRAILAMREKLFGVEHPSTLISRHNLAVLLDEQGYDEEAEELHRTAQATYAKVFGPEHPEALLSRENLAGLIGDQGRYKEAEEILREVLAVREKVSGQNHPLTCQSMTILAGLLVKLEAYEEAIDLYLQARRGFKVSLGSDHPLRRSCERKFDELCRLRGIRRHSPGPGEAEALEEWLVCSPPSTPRTTAYHASNVVSSEAGSQPQ